MISQLLDKLDEKLYKDWQQHASLMVNQMVEGFEHISFDAQENPELSNIQSALNVLTQQGKTLTREEYIKQIRIIKDNLEKISSTKDFHNVALNNFIFQARRSFNWLMVLLFTEYNKYAEAVIYPSGKEQKKPKENFLKDIAFSLGTNFAVAPLNITFDSYVGQYMSMQLEDLKAHPPIKVAMVTDYSKTKPPLSLIEQKIGTNKYLELGSNLNISQPIDAPKYVGEQIYGFCFESLFSQIAAIEDALAKVNDLSEKEKGIDTIKKVREKLLAESGLLECDSPQAKAYRDKIAQHLGFSDAKALYENYVDLNTHQGFEKFKQLKFQFMPIANQDILAINDPVENIKNEMQKENDRIKRKMASSGFSQDNINYINILNYDSTNMLLHLNGSQILKNVALLAAQDFADPRSLVGDDPGILAQMAIKAADLFVNKFDMKRYLDRVLLNTLYQDGSLLDRRMQDMNRSLNQKWVEALESRLKEKSIQRQAIFKHVQQLPFDDKALVNEYIETMRQFKTAMIHYNQSQSLSKNDPVYINIHKLYLEEKEKYFNFRDAYSHQTNQSLKSLSTIQVDDLIKKQQDKIQPLLKEYEKQVASTNALSAKINAENIRLKTTFRGRLQRFGESLAGFFGIKTKSVKKREADQQMLKQLYVQMEPIQFEIKIQTDLLAKSQKQKLNLEKYQGIGVTDLSSEIHDLINDLAVSYETIKRECEEISHNDLSSDIFSHQQRLAEIENQLIITTEALASKLDSSTLTDLSLLQLEKLEQEVQQAQILLSQFNSTISGLSDTSHLNETLNKLNHALDKQIHIFKQREQENLLRESKRFASRHIAQMSLKTLSDPFLGIIMNDELSLRKLSTDNHKFLFQYIQDEYMHRLESIDSELKSNPQMQTQYNKQLEQLFYELRLGFHRTNNKTPPTQVDSILKQHYIDLTKHIQGKLVLAYSKSDQMPFKDLKEHLFALENVFSQYREDVIKATQKFESAQEKYESSLYNPFGWLYTQDYLDKLQIDAKAKHDRLGVLTSHYGRVLENYLQQSTMYFPALDHDALLLHIDHLKSNALRLKLPEVSELQPICQLYEKILEKAVNAEKSHIAHTIHDAQDEISPAIESQLKALSVIALKINQRLASTHDFDTKLYEQYQQQTKLLISNIEKLKFSITQIDDFCKSHESQLQALGNQSARYNSIKEELEAKVGLFSSDFKLFQLPYQTLFNFYDGTVNGKSPELPKELDRAHLGTALAIAVNHQNKAMISKILHSGIHIEIHDYVVSLKQAVNQNDLDTVQNILAQNLPISSDDLFACIKSAYEHKFINIAHHLVFNTEFTLGVDEIDFLLQLASPETSISEIDRGWKQMIVDADGRKILPELRNWFAYQEQLANVLHLELFALQEQIQTYLKENNIDAIERNIKSFMSKLNRLYTIQEQTLGYLQEKTQLVFDNLEPGDNRVFDHYQKWQKELSTHIAPLSKGIMQIVNLVKPSQVMETDPLIDDVISPETLQQSMMPAETKPLNALIEHEQLKKELLEYSLGTSTVGHKSKEELHTLLTKLVINAPTDNPDTLPNTLADILNNLAKNDLYDSIEMVLSFIDEKYVTEIAAYALEQAIKAGNPNSAKILVLHKAYKSHDLDFYVLLWEKYQDALATKNVPWLTKFSDLSLLLITNLVFPLQNPTTNQLDERIKAMMMSIIDTSKASEHQEVIRSWGITDNDKPKLEALRKGFIFAEQALESLKLQTYLALRNPFENLLLEKELKDFTEFEINEFENQLALIEASFGKQLMRINFICDTYANDYPPEIFDNHSRREGYVLQWEKIHAAQTGLAKQEIEGDLKLVKQQIAEYRKLKQSSKETQPVEAKRKSVLFSGGEKPKETSIHEEAVSPNIASKVKDKKM